MDVAGKDGLGGHCNMTHVDKGVLSYLKSMFNIKTMLDVGCGPGGQIREAINLGIEAEGIDGFPGVAKLPVPIIIHDFRTGAYNHNKDYDLVWSCEFLEHVEEKFMSNYMVSFQAAKYAMVTASPSLIGYHHVNVKPEEYWIEKFAQYGFSFDEAQTAKVREESTMGRDFIRSSGLFFKRV